MPKPLTVWIKLWKISKEMEYQITWSASWEICMQVRKQQWELDMGTTDWFQTGKGVHQGCILSPCLFILYAEYIMRNAGLEEAQARIKIAGRNISNLRQCRWYHPYGRKQRRTKEPLDESERGEWKSWLKLNNQKTKIMASGLIISWQIDIDGETTERVTDFIFLAPESLQMVIAAMKLKDTCSLEEKLWPT